MKNAENTRYRVFVSYSHQDLAWVEELVEVLGDVADVMWDKSFCFGHGFDRQIELYIAHAHVFVPVVTRRSSSRGWVHQEIGYAMAHNIPVLPITIGSDALPGEMIQSIQAIRVGQDVAPVDASANGDDDCPPLSPAQCADAVRGVFTAELLENLVEDFENPELALYHCAVETEDRARLLVSYCRDIRRLKRHGMVRQAGALSSFHIPREPLRHPVWEDRYGPLHQRSRHHCLWQRRERMAFDNHARQAGFKLIVNPTLEYSAYGPAARRIRLQWLLQFLENKEEFPNGYAVIDEEQNVEQSTTIVGDWFMAEAVSAAIGKGYRQTMFTRHGPTVRAAKEEFDAEFRRLLPTGCDENDSRDWVIEEVRSILAGVEPEG